MNGKGSVATGTRQRVRAVADRLGYSPSRSARGLAAGRTGNVGFVLRNDHFRSSEPFYTRIFLGAEFEARRQGVYVLLATIPDRYNPETDAPRFLQEHSVDGVVVAGRVDGAFLEALAVQRIPYVLADYAWQNAPAVAIDNAGGAASVAAHLVARGHRRAAFIGADPGHPSIEARRDGFLRAMADAGAPVADEHVVVGRSDPSRATGAQLAAALLGRPPSQRPTAVFCANDALALGVMDTARERGVQIPADLAVVGFDDVEGAGQAVPPLTTVRVFKEQLGEVALRLLAEQAPSGDRASRFERGPAVTHISTELIVRAST
jgi:LacI family transcriptional regulator